MSEGITEAAARWHAQTANDDMDWDAFTAWLEADPRHREAYAAVALLDATVTEHRADIGAMLPAIAEPEPPRRARRWLFGAAGGAIAAAGAITLLLMPHGDRAPAPLRYATANSAEHIALADGTRIQLAPRSRLTIAGTGQDRIALTGAAYFDVPHRPGRTLTIATPALTVTDIGTRFAVTTAPALTRVEVAEGSVTVRAPHLAAPVALGAGSALVAGAGGIARGRVAPSDVASWRTGQLRYNGAPLGLVVADINRYAPDRVSIDPAIASNRFTGVLTVGNGGADLVETFAQIAALTVERRGDRAILVPRRGD